ncbi:MAG: hypothetical protein WDA00_00320 [Eubacteriales bacterium]
MMAPKVRRVTLFAGHYGSGKTNIAVNYARYLQRRGLAVAIADLDIVNPYFRTKDSMDELAEAGIPLISSVYANTNVDLPALPQALYGLVRQHDRHVVFDIGGDDRGAYALGRYAPDILAENNYEMIFVLNLYRPLTTTAESALEVMREIERAGGIPFTAIVNNSNIGWDTTPALVLSSAAEAERLSSLSGLPILMTTAEQGVAAQITEMPVFPLVLQKKYFDMKKEKGNAQGNL